MMRAVSLTFGHFLMVDDTVRWIYYAGMRGAMGIYSLGQGQYIVVYSFQKGVYFRRWWGQSWTRPQLLAGDCRGDLSDIFWRVAV